MFALIRLKCLQPCYFQLYCVHCRPTFTSRSAHIRPFKFKAHMDKDSQCPSMDRVKKPFLYYGLISFAYNWRRIIGKVAWCVGAPSAKKKTVFPPPLQSDLRHCAENKLLCEQQQRTIAKILKTGILPPSFRGTTRAQTHS